MANEKLIKQLMEELEECENKEKVYQYISEVAETCYKLCQAGEHARVLYEYNFLMNNLIKQLL